jgi:dsDNA-binding SOS-regulon protein
MIPIRLPAKRKNKYNAKKTVVDGITFHSKKEADRYCELRLLQKAGQISHLELQPVFNFT